MIIPYVIFFPPLLYKGLQLMHPRTLHIPNRLSNILLSFLISFSAVMFGTFCLFHLKLGGWRGLLSGRGK